MNQVELSIVIPGYNEAEIIEGNLRSIHASAASLAVSFEMIFVNDGSTDSTEEVVNTLRGEIRELVTITYLHNRGRGYALRQGFLHARGKYIVTIESDMNYGRGIIPDLYHAIEESAFDIVVASPYMKGGNSSHIPLKRLALSKWGNKALSASIGGAVHTVSGMTRIYRSACIKSLPLTTDDKEIHLEILSKALALGYRVSEIPAILSWPERKVRKKSKRKSSFSAKRYISSHLVFTFFERPILLFGVLGLSAFAGGIMLGAYIIYLKFAGTLNPTRPLMTLMLLMVLGGIFIVSFGLIGMQIHNLRKEIFRIQRDLHRALSNVAHLVGTDADDTTVSRLQWIKGPPVDNTTHLRIRNASPGEARQRPTTSRS
jgi:glycosyltransferase involved in cell wall biosynthesis